MVSSGNKMLAGIYEHGAYCLLYTVVYLSLENRIYNYILLFPMFLCRDVKRQLENR